MFIADLCLQHSLTLALAGVLTGIAGHNIQIDMQQPWIILTFALNLFAFGFSMFGLFDLRLPNFIQQPLHRLSQKQKGGHFIKVAVMGILATLIISPCVPLL